MPYVRLETQQELFHDSSSADLSVRIEGDPGVIEAVLTRCPATWNKAPAWHYAMIDPESGVLRTNLLDAVRIGGAGDGGCELKQFTSTVFERAPGDNIQVEVFLYEVLPSNTTTEEMQRQDDGDEELPATAAKCKKGR
eukprot:Hpha_TRINITY_DN1606_c0_g1::TRINITY_DN1606_c0_g1_i1::g.48843::m.48843